MMRAELRVSYKLDSAIIKSFKLLKNKDVPPGRGLEPPRLLVQLQSVARPRPRITRQIARCEMPASTLVFARGVAGNSSPSGAVRCRTSECVVTVLAAVRQKRDAKSR